MGAAGCRAQADVVHVSDVLTDWDTIKHLRSVPTFSMDVLELREGELVVAIDPETGHAWRLGWLKGEHVRERLPTYDQVLT